MDEAEAAFQNHPAFSTKVKVFNKYPYEERVQFGIVLRNTSASQIRLSADNFMSDLFSSVKVTKQDNYPGIAIEWVRENYGYVTQYIYDEDVSAQLGANQRQFVTANQILAGPGETHYADSPGQVEVYVDGVRTVPEVVDGENKKVMLYECPGLGSTVTVGYHIRRIATPGIYTVDFIDDYAFTVHPRFRIDGEILVAQTTGSEVTVSLAHGTIDPASSGIDPTSERILLTYYDGTVIKVLIRDTDYTIDDSTGLINFSNPLPANYQVRAEYLYIPTTYPYGPYTFKIYQENHIAIPGVVISIGRRAKKGDQQIIEVSKFREQQAKIYGGHWTMMFDLAVIAKDPLQMEEMSDQLVNWLWAVRKNQLEFEGITMNSVEPSGEAEEAHIETTGDMYYESSVAVNVQTEWQYFVPYDLKVMLQSANTQADLRPVYKGPIVGHERLT